jgi:hypothetical protein
LAFYETGKRFVFALAAEPRIKTNFYSSSYASCCNFASLVDYSTLLECVPLYYALNSFYSLSSYSLNFYSHLSSIAVMVSVLILTYYCYGVFYDTS